MSNIFFTADPHFDHRNIILHAERKPWICSNPDYDANKDWHFKYNNDKGVNLKSHNESLIKFWNKMVSKGDEVYIAGDFAWKNHLHFLMALNGKKYIILGNHDKASQEVYKNFSGVYDFGMRKRFYGIDYTVCHYALRSWASSCHGARHLYGHSHGRLPEFDNMLCFDVGIDVWGYAPVPFEAIDEKMRMIEKLCSGKPIDGEQAAKGLYSKLPEERVKEVRAKNLSILRKLNIPTFVDDQGNLTSLCE